MMQSLLSCTVTRMRQGITMDSSDCSSDALRHLRQRDRSSKSENKSHTVMPLQVLLSTTTTTHVHRRNKIFMLRPLPPPATRTASTYDNTLSSSCTVAIEADSLDPVVLPSHLTLFITTIILKNKTTKGPVKNYSGRSMGV